MPGGVQILFVIGQWSLLMVHVFVVSIILLHSVCPIGRIADLALLTLISHKRCQILLRLQQIASEFTVILIDIILFVEQR